MSNLRPNFSVLRGLTGQNRVKFQSGARCPVEASISAGRQPKQARRNGTLPGQAFGFDRALSATNPCSQLSSFIALSARS